MQIANEKAKKPKTSALKMLFRISFFHLQKFQEQRILPIKMTRSDFHFLHQNFQLRVQKIYMLRNSSNSIFKQPTNDSSQISKKQLYKITFRIFFRFFIFRISNSNLFSDKNSEKSNILNF